MACIQVTAEIKGEADTKALLGARYSVSAKCLGVAAASRPAPPPRYQIPPPPQKG